MFDGNAPQPRLSHNRIKGLSRVENVYPPASPTGKRDLNELARLVGLTIRAPTEEGGSECDFDDEKKDHSPHSHLTKGTLHGQKDHIGGDREKETKQEQETEKEKEKEREKDMDSRREEIMKKTYSNPQMRLSLLPLKARLETRSISAPNSPKETSPRRRCATIETDSIQYSSNNDVEEINQYKLFQVLGKGMFGTVRLCRNEDTKKLHAVKCLSKKRLKRKGGFGRGKRPGQQDGLQDLKREIAILKKVVHPHVVRLFEVMDDPRCDIVYMVFELLKLGCVMDMSTPSSVKKFSEAKACTYMRQVVLGVEFLHSHHVIHRDIKPSNLLLYTNDILKISDFGVSHIFDENDTLAKTAGTPAFMAPEAINVSGSKFEGKPVDLWAVGVTMFCFLYAKTPFKGANVMKLYEVIREERISFPNDEPISTEAKDLMRQLLEKDPKQRIAMSCLRSHPWITRFGTEALISTEENCTSIEVTEEEVEKSLTPVTPKLHTLLLVKSMVRRRSFKNPFRNLHVDKMRGRSGSNPVSSKPCSSLKPTMEISRPSSAPTVAVVGSPLRTPSPPNLTTTAITSSVRTTKIKRLTAAELQKESELERSLQHERRPRSIQIKRTASRRSSASHSHV